MNELIIWFRENYPVLVRLMKDTDHAFDDSKSNPWHIEGDIWAHTMMVCKEAENSTKVNQVVALLHDIGKCFTREVIENRVRFLGHEGVSFFIAIDIVKHLAKDGLILEEEKLPILRTISQHGILFDFIKEGQEYNASKVVNKFKEYRDFKYLIDQVRHDSLGRFHTGGRDAGNISKGLGTVIYSVDTFRTYTKVYGAGEYNKTITVLIGLPGSGKSTWVENNTSDKTVVISRDAYVESFANVGYSENWKLMTEEDHKKADEWILSEFNKAIKAGKDIIIDMTNTSAKSRRKWLNPASQRQYKTRAIVLMTSLEECRIRCKKREGKNIPEYVLYNMAKAFMFPGYDEVQEINTVY